VVLVFHHGVHGAASASTVHSRSMTRRPLSRLWHLSIWFLLRYATASHPSTSTSVNRSQLLDNTASIFNLEKQEKDLARQRRNRCENTLEIASNEYWSIIDIIPLELS
jgi:hypothetical protein